MRPSQKQLKAGARIIWGMADDEAYKAYWEEIWEYETRPERVKRIGEWWPITATRQILALKNRSRA